MFILTRMSDSGVVVSQLQCSVASMCTNFVQSNMVKNQNFCIGESEEEEECFSLKTVTVDVHNPSNITRMNTNNGSSFFIIKIRYGVKEQEKHLENRYQLNTDHKGKTLTLLSS